MRPAAPIAAALIRRGCLRATIVLAILTGWLVGVEIHSLQLALMYLAPALLLLALLASRRYPGADTLERWGRRRPGGGLRKRLSRVRAKVPRAPTRGQLRGGALLASGLAGRAPPVPAGAAT